MPRVVKGHLIWLEHFIEVETIREVVGRAGTSYQYEVIETKLVG